MENDSVCLGTGNMAGVDTCGREAPGWGNRHPHSTSNLLGNREERGAKIIQAGVKCLGLFFYYIAKKNS